MQTVKIIIVEDELIIAESLKGMLENMGYKVVDIFMSGTEMLSNFSPGMADMVFMDIHLAGNTSGIDTAVELRNISNIPIVYLTQSRDDYLRKKAILETNAVHYITKPFSKTDICTAIDFALKQLKTYEFAALKQGEGAYLLKDSIFLKMASALKK